MLANWLVRKTVKLPWTQPFQLLGVWQVALALFPVPQNHLKKASSPTSLPPLSWSALSTATPQNKDCAPQVTSWSSSVRRDHSTQGKDTWGISSVSVHLCWCSISVTVGTQGKWRQTMGCKWLQFSGTRNSSSFSHKTPCKRTEWEKAGKWNFNKGNQNELLEFPAKTDWINLGNTSAGNEWVSSSTDNCWVKQETCGWWWEVRLVWRSCWEKPAALVSLRHWADQQIGSKAMRGALSPEHLHQQDGCRAGDFTRGSSQCWEGLVLGTSSLLMQTASLVSEGEVKLVKTEAW